VDHARAAAEAAPHALNELNENKWRVLNWGQSEMPARLPESAGALDPTMVIDNERAKSTQRE